MLEDRLNKIKKQSKTEHGRNNAALQAIVSRNRVRPPDGVEYHIVANITILLCFICGALHQVLIILYNLSTYSNYTKFVRKIMVLSAGLPQTNRL